MGTPRLSRSDKLHHKFAVIDGKTVITGSFNWSPAAAHTNDETLLVIHSPTLTASHFTREMDRLWEALSSASPHGCSARAGAQPTALRQKTRSADVAGQTPIQHFTGMEGAPIPGPLISCAGTN